MYGSEWGWHHMPGMWFGGGLLLVVAVLLVFAVLSRTDERSGNSAKDILDERYARGDIDREEYLQKRKDLSE